MVRQVHNRCNEEVFGVNILVQAMPHNELLKRTPAKEQESDKTRVLLHLKKMDVGRYVFKKMDVGRYVFLTIAFQYFMKPFRGNAEAN